MAKKNLLGRFRNVILCDDVRLEVGNKRSLMGVFSGDIIAATFPATIRIAVYVEYAVSPDMEPHEVKLELFQEETPMGHATIRVEPKAQGTALLVLPQGYGVFERPCTFSINATVEGRKIEILKKKVMKGEVNRPTA